MLKPAFALLLSLFVTLCGSGQASPVPTPNSRSVEIPPRIDHHQHVFSSGMVVHQNLTQYGITVFSAEEVIKLLDAAQIKRAVVLSTAYSYGRPGREPQNEYERVKEENDWVAAEVAKYPQRLIGFCGVNPRKDYALQEIERCAKNPHIRHGLKLHFGNSDVQLENPTHVERMKAVFKAANDNRMAIVIHMRASLSLNRPYGPEQARLFIDHLLPVAKDVTVQIAHLAGTGPGYNDPKADTVLDVFIDAIAKKDPRMRNVWFDIATQAHPTNSPERTALLAKRLRQIGLDRILYGTDGAFGSNINPRDSWNQVSRLDLTDKELRKIAGNTAPYLR